MDCVGGSSQNLPVVKKEVTGIQEVYFFDEELSKNEHSSNERISDERKSELDESVQNRGMFPVMGEDSDTDVHEVIGENVGNSNTGSTDDIRNTQENEEDMMVIERDIPRDVKKFPSSTVRGTKGQISYRVVDESHLNITKDQDSYKRKIITKDDPRSHTHYVKFFKKEGKTHKIWECGICSKEFRHQYTLMRHLPTHTDERNYKCETCGKGFRQMSTLSQHRAIHSDARPYVCELCRKTFNRISTLISHRKTHSNNKPHKCEVCGKGFHQKGNLRNHTFTHTNERPYKCESCGKGFNQMSNLMCHKVKAHSHGSKRYVCNTCHLEFSCKYSLTSHEQYEHGFKSRGNQRAEEYYPSMFQVFKTEMSDDFVQSHKMVNDFDDKGSSLGVVIDPITTKAMSMAKQTGQTPFALLKLAKGNPVLVKVMTTANGKHILLPATAEDLKSANMVTVFPNTDSTRGGSSIKALQIKVPIVATVIQKVDADGNFTIAVESPSFNEEITSLCDDHDNLNETNTAVTSVELKSPSPNNQFIFKNRNGIGKNDDCKLDTDILLQKAVSMIEKDQSMTPSVETEQSVESGLMEMVSNDDNIQFVCTSGDGIYKVLSQEEIENNIKEPGQTIEVVTENNLMEGDSRASPLNKNNLKHIVEAMCSAGYQVTGEQEEIVLTEPEEVVLGEFDFSMNPQAVYAQPEEIVP